MTFSVSNKNPLGFLNLHLKCIKNLTLQEGYVILTILFDPTMKKKKKKNTQDTLV